MINIISSKDCCGCKNCVNACAVNCIDMQEDKLKHLIPKVNAERCVSCNMCESVCPMMGENPTISSKHEVFAAYSDNREIRRSGSSGGMFETFARHLLKCGYHIYGAAFDRQLNLVTTSAKNEEELTPLLKSKYLICDTSDKFFEIKKRLEEGKKVFYVSSPCQVAALKKYLLKEYENLITMDFFCHGVPSAGFFKECIAFDERKKYGGNKIVSYSFREKKPKGSTPHYFSLELENGKREFDYYFNSTFYAAFQKYVSLRESCYECKFSGRDRVSDLTVGDFHDIDRYIYGINRFDGVSTVVINTLAGLKLWNDCKNSISYYPMNIDNLIADKVIFAGGTKRPPITDRFILEYEQNGLDGIYEKFLKPSLYLKNKIYYSLPAFLRNTIKRIKG